MAATLRKWKSIRKTGWVDVLSYCAVDDCGNVIDHTLLEGQVHGGLAQGLGTGAVRERDL